MSVVLRSPHAAFGFILLAACGRTAVLNSQTQVTSPPSVSTSGFAYVGSGWGVYGYSVDGSTGNLIPLEPVRCDSGGLVAVATHPSGRFAYAADVVGGIRAYQVDSKTGALTRLPGLELPTGGEPVSIAVEPMGRFLYAGNYEGTVSAYAIDAATGFLSAVIGSPFASGRGTNSVTIDPTGRFLYTANNGSDDVSAFSIDRNTGALVPVPGSPFTSGGIAMDLAIDPLGSFAFAANFVLGSWTNPGSISAFAIDAGSGGLSSTTASTASPFNAGEGTSGLAVEPQGRFLYAANPSSDSISGYQIDRSSGTLSPLASSPFALGGGPYSIAAHDRFLYVSRNYEGSISILAIDPTTGGLREISGSPVPASGSGEGPAYSFAFTQ